MKFAMVASNTRRREEVLNLPKDYPPLCLSCSARDMTKLLTAGVY